MWVSMPNIIIIFLLRFQIIHKNIMKKSTLSTVAIEET